METLLVDRRDGIVTITGKGLLLARMIAAAFDPLQNGKTGDSLSMEPRYSKAI